MHCSSFPYVDHQVNHRLVGLSFQSLSREYMLDFGAGLQVFMRTGVGLVLVM